MGKRHPRIGHCGGDRRHERCGRRSETSAVALVPRSAAPELRPDEAPVAPGAALLALCLLLDRDVAGAPPVGEGEALGYQDTRHVLAANEADREFTRVPVDELLVDLTAEARHRHQLTEPARGDRAAVEKTAAGVATGLQPLEGVDAEEAKPQRRTGQPEMGEQT